MWKVFKLLGRSNGHRYSSKIMLNLHLGPHWIQHIAMVINPTRNHLWAPQTQAFSCICVQTRKNYSLIAAKSYCQSFIWQTNEPYHRALLSVCFRFPIYKILFLTISSLFYLEQDCTEALDTSSAKDRRRERGVSHSGQSKAFCVTNVGSHLYLILRK